MAKKIIMKKLRSLFLVFALLKFGNLCFAQVPTTWTVNPADYQYQMTVTGKANEACVDLADTNNYIAAFVGAQCRGVVKTRTTAGTNKLGLLIIYSNVVAGEKVKFQIYNASASHVTAVLDSVTFSQGSSTGTLGNPFVLYTNHVPTDIAISNYTVAENSSLGTVIAALTATDQDAGTLFNYSLTAAQAEGTQFAISGTNLTVNSNFNYESDSIKVIELQVDDFGGCKYVETFTIIVKDANDAPTALFLSSVIISDHQQGGSFMGKFFTTDEDFFDIHTYTLVAGTGDTDNSAFYVSNDTLYNVSQIGYTAQSFYSIRARSTDKGGLFIEAVFTLTVTNVNDAPSDILLSNFNVNENMPAGTTIGTFTVVDIDPIDSHTLTLVAGSGSSDNSLVMIVGNVLQTNASYNYEQKDSLFIRVQAMDLMGATFVKTFTILVNDINDAPTDISISSDSVPELQPPNTLVGNFSSTDEDAGATHTYSLVAGSGDTDNALFVISGNQLQSAITFTFSAQTYSVRVQTTDNGGLTYQKSFLIRILNVNEPPTDIIIDTTFVNEDNNPMYYISRIHSVDRDSDDTYTYALVSGSGDDNNAEFTIVGDSLFVNEKTNYEVKDVYHIRVRSTDQGALSVGKTFDITVNDIAGNTIPLPSTNYISPNGDGKNDYWKVDNIAVYEDFALQVFDQFGQVIYSVANHYNNEFDGKYNGKSLPTGNYYYVFKKGEKIFKGNITIVN